MTEWLLAQWNNWFRDVFKTLADIAAVATVLWTIAQAIRNAIDEHLGRVSKRRAFNNLKLGISELEAVGLFWNAPHRISATILKHLTHFFVITWFGLLANMFGFPLALPFIIILAPWMWGAIKNAISDIEAIGGPGAVCLERQSLVVGAIINAKKVGAISEEVADKLIHELTPPLEPRAAVETARRLEAMAGICQEASSLGLELARTPEAVGGQDVV